MYKKFLLTIGCGILVCAIHRIFRKRVDSHKYLEVILVGWMHGSEIKIRLEKLLGKKVDITDFHADLTKLRKSGQLECRPCPGSSPPDYKYRRVRRRPSAKVPEKDTSSPPIE